jgi:two-component system response regulator FlrC
MQPGLILVVEDDETLREAVQQTLTQAGFRVVAVADAEAGLTQLGKGKFGLIVSDVQLPGMNGYRFLEQVRRSAPQVPVLIMTAFGTVSDAVAAMRSGAADYLVKPFAAELLIGKVRQFCGADRPLGVDFIVEDESMRATVALAAQVAPTEATVMISGESGTGKEVLARYLHRRSNRSAGPFVAINCAAIPENMLEALLFGYEKGAFTGAVQATPGKFEQAQGGTLLLDEVSELDLALQAKLLRVLQEREVERIGGRHVIPLNVRVLATTNRHLRAAVAGGEFREDLYFRLNVFPLEVPPLRRRPRDILPLAHFLLHKHARANGRTALRLSEAAARLLLDHAWPGNVRELDNLLLRALVLQPGAVIDAADLNIDVPGPRGADSAAAGIEEAGESLGRNLKSHEHGLIIDALRAENGSRKQAAERLGISPRTLRYKLAQMRSSGMPVAV